MVLQPRVRSPFPAPHARRAPQDAQRPDPVRIAGIAGALALNAAALMLMLAPLTHPPAEPAAPRGLEAEWFEPRPVPPPPPPEIVPLQPAVVPPAPAAPAQRSIVRDPAPVAPPVLVDSSIAADPAPPADTGGNADPGAGQGLATGARLAYAQASAPPYPRDALRMGHQGTVVLEVLVDVDGRPLEVRVQSGSGYRQLDEAARRHVLRNWRFQPAMRDGRAVQALGLVPIEFSLDRG